MSSSRFLVDKDPSRHLATVTLNHPQDGNKLTDPDIAALASSVRALASDADVKLILLKSTGERFCMGRIAGPKPPVPPSALDIRNRVSSTIMELYASVRNAAVPVIGIVQGEASGFGCAMAAQCDMTIASEAATFSLPELDHDFPPTLAMSALLHRVPPKILADMVYTRRVLSAADAYRFGLVTDVVPAAGLQAASDRMVAALSDRSRVALGTIKEYLAAALYVDQAASAKLAENMIAVAIASNG